MRFLTIVAFMLIAFSATPTSAEVGQACGGIAGTACGDGEFCKYGVGAMCGAADAAGTCATKPEVCTADYMPVCGCDGMTYSNACTAAANGASVAYVGTCRVTDDRTCVQAIACGIKDGKAKEYPTPCAAQEDGATNIKMGKCAATE